VSQTNGYLGDMEIHDDIRSLEFLLGTWVGEGEGVYPTIQPFAYTEQVTFTPGPGKPFLAYTQKTWRGGTREPLHSESGYLRGFGNETVEFVIAQPTGIVEVHVGTVIGHRLTMEGKAITTLSARSVTATRRVIEVSGDQLTYQLDMAAVGQELQHHLKATLKRVGE
jgi:hypothetical protein